jgi:hypothetical protein
VPDEIPAVHVLEAAENQERKDTEDLLSAFDRPGRGPSRPSGGERDFVDYYSKKKGEGPGSDRGMAAARPAGALPVALSPRPSDESTLVRRRPKLPTQGLPPWLGWAGAVFAMLFVGGVAAYFATGDVGPKARASGPPSAPTITAATPSAPTTQAPPPQAARPSEDIPPPSAAEPNASAAATPTGAIAPSGPSANVAPAPAPVVTDPPPASTDPAPRASARKDARPPASAGAAPSGAAGAPRGAADPRANGDRKPPPRDDFIRDL